MNTGGANDKRDDHPHFNSGKVRDFAGNGGDFLGLRTLSAAGETSVTVADFNGDGKLDLLTGGANVPGPGYDNFSIRLGNGNGTFGAAQGFSTNPDGHSAVQTTAADFNGDGKLDVAVTTRDAFNGGKVAIALGNGDGTF